MKEIVVISGKGGTGKTTVLACYARMSESAVIADCDVDAPNLHLLVRPDTIKKELFVGSKLAWIEASKCSNCQDCVPFCRFGAIKVVGRFGINKVAIDGGLCEGCGLGARMCPSRAITMMEKVVGEWFVSDTKYGMMIHAQLKPGEENSGRLVAMVKQQAKMVARENGAALVLVDGPPGIGCPVISSLSGADLALIVTEPTKSGKSDYVRIADLGKGFGLKMALIVNRADLNPGLTEEIVADARERQIPCIGTIPYDEELMKAMARGAENLDELSGPAVDQIAMTYEAATEILDVHL